MEQKINFKINVIAETAILISLSFVLRTFLILFRMPNGGSVNLGLTPLIILSFRRNAFVGCLAGLIVSIIHVFSSVHVPPASDAFKIVFCILFDYLIPYSCVGLCSLLKKSTLDNRIKIFLGVSLVFLINIVCFCTSGLTIWKDAIPNDQNILKYVLFYNLVFCFPNYLANMLSCISLKKFCFPKI